MEKAVVKIVKLGGSVITVKDKFKALRTDVAKRLVSELSRYYKESGESARVVVIHGGGSYGHPIVKDCVSKYGFIDRDCYVETADSMDTLNYVLKKYALAAGLPVVSLPPRSFCTISSKNPVCHIEALATLLYKGLVPLTYGDVITSDKGFEVISGDTLAWYIARELRIGEIVFVTDVDGLYDSDPKTNPGAKKISRASIDEVLGFLSISSSKVDVTGGMMRKLYEGRVLGLRNVKVKIVSGFIENNLYSALTSDNFVGSVVCY
ncbi:MAG: isopentenyl phosphate kinase [Sulfolobales archaeon]